jgi:hypothetical protein
MRMDAVMTCLPGINGAVGAGAAIGIAISAIPPYFNYYRYVNAICGGDRVRCMKQKHTRAIIENFMAGGAVT